MSSTSRRTCVIRWRCPRCQPPAGSVTSTRSSFSRRSSSSRSSSASRAAKTSSTARRATLYACPADGSLISRPASLILLLLPRYVVRALRSSSSVAAALPAAIASSVMSCRSTGLRGYRRRKNQTVDPYAGFTEVYDAWSAHMTEDVDFYVDLAREAADGPIVELG